MVEPDKAVLWLLGEVGAVRHLGDEMVDPGQLDVGALDAGPNTSSSGTRVSPSSVS